MRFHFRFIAVAAWAVCALVALTGEIAQAKPKVELGIDVLAANQFRGLEGKRIGLITNPTGVSSNGRSTIDILRSAPNVNLVALYAPEHGVYGAELAGDYVASTKDARTGLPVYSLYGPTRKPTPEMLKNIDVLMYDIQDIGCRSYTFISTLGLAMEAAGEAGIEFYVLDRPNPLGGNRVEGMPLDPKFRSFVGQWDIPYVYGLTPGELARLINAQKWIAKRPKLTIVPMRGWYRSMYWQDTGLEWVPSSPHIPTSDTCFFYVVTGLVGEGLPVNHGIGYTLPFQLLGRDDFHAFKLADQLNALKLSGVYFRPTFYKPFYGGLKDKMCQGVQVVINDPDEVNLANLSVILMEQIHKYTGGALFAKDPPADGKGPSMFDKVAGGDELRKHFKAGGSARELIASWQPSLEAFRKLREPYLIYSNHPSASAPVPAAPSSSTPPTSMTSSSSSSTKKSEAKAPASSTETTEKSAASKTSAAKADTAQKDSAVKKDATTTATTATAKKKAQTAKAKTSASTTAKSTAKTDKSKPKAAAKTATATASSNSSPPATASTSAATTTSSTTASTPAASSSSATAVPSATSSSTTSSSTNH